MQKETELNKETSLFSTERIDDVIIMLGVSKAYKILLSGKNITAYEALELGIVDKVVPLNELEESGRVAANWFAKKPLRTLQGVKRLLNHSKGNLKENLEIENEEILRTINDTDFWKTVYEADIHNIDIGQKQEYQGILEARI